MRSYGWQQRTLTLPKLFRSDAYSLLYLCGCVYVDFHVLNAAIDRRR